MIEWWEGLSVDFTLPVHIKSQADIEMAVSMISVGAPRHGGGAVILERSLRRPKIDLKSRLAKKPGPVAPQAWSACKHEFRLLVCSNGPRYAELRLALAGLGAVSGTLVVTRIVEGFCPYVPVPHAELTTLVTVGVGALAALGRFAFCEPPAG